jgi:hypothetical protein
MLKNGIIGVTAVAGSLWVDDITLTEPTPIPRQVVQDFNSSLLFPRSGATGSVIVKSGVILAGQANFSILAWAKFNTGAANQSVVYCERAAAGSDILKFQADLGSGVNKLLFSYRDDAAVVNQVTGNTLIKDGQWHPIAVTKAGTTLKLYVDGRLDKTSTLTTGDTLTNASMSSRIGSDIASAGETMDGWLAKVAVYRSTLTDTQVRDAGLAGLYPSGSAGFWELNEGAGTSAADSSGNGNTGTVANVSYSADVPMKRRAVVGQSFRTLAT